MYVVFVTTALPQIVRYMSLNYRTITFHLLVSFIPVIRNRIAAPPPVAFTPNPPLSKPSQIPIPHPTALFFLTYNFPSNFSNPRPPLFPRFDVNPTQLLFRCRFRQILNHPTQKFNRRPHMPSTVSIRSKGERRIKTAQVSALCDSCKYHVRRSTHCRIRKAVCTHISHPKEKTWA